MKKYPVSPIHTWLERKTGLVGEALNQKNLLEYQLKMLRNTLGYAKAHSGFYQERLCDVEAKSICTWEDLKKIPFTCAEDIIQEGNRLVCIPQRDIMRITTIFTSGSTKRPKRIYFSGKDLDTTVDFFAWGMSCMVDNTDTVLILMPSAAKWSVGDFLKRALGRIGVGYAAYGAVSDYDEAIDKLRESGVTCIVGIPSQVYRMAKLAPSLSVKTVLLSADYVPDSVAELIHRNWGAEVFSHYGITEAGLGGGVECHAHEGYHMRDGDLLFEIVDPDTGAHVPPGTVGEIVFSTLTRDAMPLIRYRTGDLAMFLPGECPCGMNILRLGKVQGRMSNRLELLDGTHISIHDLDEVLFSMESVLDYTVSLRQQNGCDTLQLALLTNGNYEKEKMSSVLREKLGIQCPIEVIQGEGFYTRGTAKRKIAVKEE